MTTEQKARAYDEALERARAINNGKDVDIEAGTTTCEYIFQELKESEDEKIRKSIISILNGEIRCVSIEDTNKYVTWLEKQGEIDLEHYKDGENEKRKFVGYGFLKCKGDFLSFKEGETYWLEYVGNDNYNVRSDNLLGQTFHIKPVELYTVFRPTTWLEKQGEQTHAVLGQSEVTKTGGKEQSDNVEPKFHEGDWVVNEVAGSVYQIRNCVENLNNHKYGYDLTNGGYIGSDEVNYYHLWTIQDAKDGDVLVASDGSIFLFAGVVDCACKYYAALTTDNYVKINKDTKGGYWETSRAVHPATKEQGDLLFQKIKEAGYEWDSEKKELKKISHKTLDPDKVIEWLDRRWPYKREWGSRSSQVAEAIEQFKQDFGL